MDDLRALEENLNLEISDYSLLERALTHRSYLNENPGTALEDNERLEFLGDTILGTVVAEHLFRELPADDEGRLTRIKSEVVSTRALAAAGRPWPCLWGAARGPPRA